MTKLLGLLGLLVLAGCTTGPTPEEVRAELHADCKAAGFTEGSESYRLCLLIQENNRRLAGVERRLSFIEQDTRFGGFYGPPNFRR